MKSSLNKLLNNEIFLYLVFGLATTIFYIIVRLFLFNLFSNVLLVTFIANSLAILFAFVTNDQIVFRQEKVGWQKRLVKFISARIVTLLLDMAIAYFFVDLAPGIIGRFVQQDLKKVNAIATFIGQVLIVILNYVLGKVFVFQKTAPSTAHKG